MRNIKVHSVISFFAKLCHPASHATWHTANSFSLLSSPCFRLAQKMGHDFLKQRNQTCRGAALGYRTSPATVCLWLWCHARLWTGMLNKLKYNSLRNALMNFVLQRATTVIDYNTIVIFSFTKRNDFSCNIKLNGEERQERMLTTW